MVQWIDEESKEDAIDRELIDELSSNHTYDSIFFELFEQES